MRKTALILILAAAGGVSLDAQAIDQVTLDEAVRRAIANNPSVQQAEVNILRSQSVLQQVRARSLPSVDATFTTNVIEPVTSFSGSSIVPRTQTATTAAISVPLFVPVNWAQRGQAADQVEVSQRAADDARRRIATATAEAYLQVLALKRVLALNEQARDNARAHYEYANQRFEGGIGSRLNAVRAQQEVSDNEARVEAARLGIRRAQEALGVLVAADGPVDAMADPVFDVPPPTVPDREFVYSRADLRSIVRRQTAAERVARDSWRDYLPSVTALFNPQYLAPSGLFSQPQSLRGAVLFSIPIFEGGSRRGVERERLALVDVVRLERAEAERQATSEIRIAREAVAATERALEHARASVQQASEVVRISDVAYREGATTNIELIDAQRQARDAETTAVIAEDAVRRARLDLLVATGRFPQ